MAYQTRRFGRTVALGRAGLASRRAPSRYDARVPKWKGAPQNCENELLPDVLSSSLSPCRGPAMLSS